MWSYYGAKTNIVDCYPPPKFDKIIEPFAGTARYALKYFEKDVLLIDKYDIIIKIWKWLQQCSEADVLSLPRFKIGDNINEHQYDCEEQRFLMGYLCGFSFRRPTDIAVVRDRDRPMQLNHRINNIASQLFKIRHWEIIQADYTDVDNKQATWFIDPPYQFGGEWYARSNKHINYEELKTWCEARTGQIIVCENSKANWMSFKPMVTQNVLSGKNQEAIWSNLPTAFDNVQLELDV